MPSSRKVHGTIVSVLELERDRVNAGANLRVRFTVWNQNSEPLRIRFTSGQIYDFVVEDESGQEKWRWSYGRMFTMALLEKELGPEKWVFEETIPTLDNQGRELPPGRYRLRARLLGGTGVENWLFFRVQADSSRHSP